MKKLILMYLLSVACMISAAGASNQAPVAVDDQFGFEWDPDIGQVYDYFGYLNVLENDYDPDGDPLNAVLVTGILSNGTVTLYPDGTFRYAAGLYFLGTDFFYYRAYDGENYSDIAEVSVKIMPSDEGPCAVDDYYEVKQDTVLFVEEIGVKENDVYFAGIIPFLNTYVAEMPYHGILELEKNGSFTYTPDTGYVGTDTFKYIIDEDQVLFDRATVTINVKKDVPGVPEFPGKIAMPLLFAGMAAVAMALLRQRAGS